MKTLSLEKYVFKVHFRDQLTPEWCPYGQFLSVPVNDYWKGPTFVPLGTRLYRVANVGNALVLRLSWIKLISLVTTTPHRPLLLGGGLRQQSLISLLTLRSFYAAARKYLNFHGALYHQYISLFLAVLWSSSHDTIFGDNNSSTSPPVNCYHVIYYDSHVKPDCRTLRSTPV